MPKHFILEEIDRYFGVESSHEVEEDTRSNGRRDGADDDSFTGSDNEKIQQRQAETAEEEMISFFNRSLSSRATNETSQDKRGFASSKLEEMKSFFNRSMSSTGRATSAASEDMRRLAATKLEEMTSFFNRSMPSGETNESSKDLRGLASSKLAMVVGCCLVFLGILLLSALTRRNENLESSPAFSVITNAPSKAPLWRGTPAPTSPSTTVDTFFPVLSDVTLRGGRFADLNFGGSINLEVRHGSGDQQAFTLLEFDVHGIPYMISPQDKVLLRMTHVLSNTEQTAASITVEKVPNIDSDIERLTFANYSDVSGEIGPTFVVDDDTNDVEVDITMLVRPANHLRHNHRAPEDKILLKLHSKDESNQAGEEFRSQQFEDGQAPVIVYQRVATSLPDFPTTNTSLSLNEDTINPIGDSISSDIVSRSPTKKPTLAPTEMSSGQPSSSPSGVPTKSASPTSAPTAEPSKKPSHSPSSAPSSRPSNTPSSSPSTLPTTTALPSVPPTWQPSQYPSSSPSGGPSDQPSKIPSLIPTISVEPSISPTTTPSRQPTHAPTRAPSEMTSQIVSTVPTLSLQSSPSTNGIFQDSNFVVPQESTKPSSAPSQNIAAPSPRPTENPTTIAAPSPRPTENPTTIPTANPTKNPTGQPSSAPTRRPSANPTQQPSEQPSSAPSSSPTETIELDESLLRLSLQAAELSGAIMLPNTQELYPNATIFTDEPDEALVVNIEDVCFVAFRGTLESSPADIKQNLDLGLADDVCYNGECCPTRQGYRDAFLNVSYFQEFGAAVFECMYSCCDSIGCQDEFDQECEVVMTGFSQGGSAAQVAAVMMRDTNPTTITFGQPTTMQAPCAPLDNSKYFRFVNTLKYDSGLKYDAAPFVEITGAVQSGQAFVLNENSTGVAYYRNGEAPDINFRNWAPNWLTVHNMDSYISRLEYLVSNSALPVSLDGFDSGLPCTMNSECKAPESCDFGYCSSDPGFRGFAVQSGGANEGDPCESHSDCGPSARCDGLFFKTCKAKLQSNTPCSENEDCISGSCQGAFFSSPVCV